LLPGYAKSGGQIDNTFTEGVGGGVPIGGREKRLLPTDFLGLGDDMGQAGLPVPAATVIEDGKKVVRPVSWMGIR